MPGPVALGEVPFFSQLPADWQLPLQDYLKTTFLEQVEILPGEKKWIFHLTAAEYLDPALFNPLSELLLAHVPEIGHIDWRLAWQAPAASLQEICRLHWPEITSELGDLLPGIRGWLREETPIEVVGEQLIIRMANVLGAEYIRAKHKALEKYLYQRFGITVQVSCELEEEGTTAEYFALAEVAEQEYLQELLARQAEPALKPAASQARDNSILGREFKAEPIPLRQVEDEERQIVVSGEVFNLDYRPLKSGRKLLTFDITDKTDSISAKVFLKEEQTELDLKNGDWISLRGPVQFDRYTAVLTLMPRDIQRTRPSIREDKAEAKRIELHLHTRMSTMDAVASAEDLIKRAAFWGHKSLAITDHGVVQAFPEAVAAGQKHKVKIILGVEGYLLDDAPGSPAPSQQKSRHIVILVCNAVGLKNLYRLITLSHLDHFYRRPRMPRSQINKYREGLFLGSACEAGELIQAILRKESWEKLLQIAAFYDYLEIQPLGNNSFLLRNGQVSGIEELQEINKTVVRLGKTLQKPVVATGDVHFLDPEDEVYRRILMAGNGYEDADQQAPLYYRTTEEMLSEFTYLSREEALEVVVYAPERIARQIEELKPFPDDLFSPTIPGAEEKIRQMSWERAYQLYNNPLPEIVQKRLEKELKSIIGHGFSVLYLIAHLLVKKSNDDGYLVGSRGSVGSSLVATMTGITEVNPLPPHYRCPNSACLHSLWIEEGSVGAGMDLPDCACPKCGQPLAKDGFDIPFETFLGFEGDKVPDIDLNFSGEYQSRAHRYTEELFGRDYVFRAGTIATIADKTAFGYVKNYLEERKLRLKPAEMARLVNGCTGVKRTTGQHPGGLMVVPKDYDIHDFTPLQRPADDPKSPLLTTHFDYHSISGRLVKLDILGHDDPTALKMLEKLTGIKARTVSLDDPETMSLFSGTEALGVTTQELRTKTGTYGIPEFGTKFVRQMLEDTQPRTFSDLVRICGLSHGTDVWLGNAQELVRSGQAAISEIIACRDDIMVYLISKGLDPVKAFKIMENVRKGKGLKAEDVEAMRSHDVPNWYIESCQKIKYMFPKAHAVAYVMMSFRIAWYKLHYPAAFYATFFTVRADEFDIDLICQGRQACLQKIEEIENKGNEATAREKNLQIILELAVEMDFRGIPILKVDLQKSEATSFMLTPQGLLPPFTSLQGLGETAARSIVALRSENGITSVEDLRISAKLSKTVIEILDRHGCLQGLPEENQLSFFAENRVALYK
jgi:DNA polymerase-3 subunit alpha (Gram-positive type)